MKILFRAVADNRNPDSLASQMRRRRLQKFIGLVNQLEKPLTILDVGGTESFWKTISRTIPEGLHITLLNLWEMPVSLPNCVSIAGDARAIAFPDRHFDLVFSNSVIEHLFDFQSQQRMAREVARVGRAYFIQTPNRYFPIEPHFLVPGWQFLPLALRTAIIQRTRVGWIDRASDFSDAITKIEHIRLLTRREMKLLFPQAEIYEEKALGLTKSFVAIGGDWNT